MQRLIVGLGIRPVAEKTKLPTYDYNARGRHEDSRYIKLVVALQEIAKGNGTYGAQAFEYKNIARDALVSVGEPYID
jgi:hypothetical protein